MSLKPTNNIPPSGTPYNIKFNIKNIQNFPIINLEFYKDINNPINGGNLTTPLNIKLYQQLHVNQIFTLSWNWNPQNPIKIMTGYLSNIQIEKNTIKIQFTDKGAHLRKHQKLKYTKKPRLNIIKDIIIQSGLKPHIDWSNGLGEIINYDSGSNDLQGKTYEEMLKELIEESTTDLIITIKEDACKIVNTLKTPKNNNLSIHEGVNIIKDTISISENASETVNHITLYYKDETHKNYIIQQDKNSIRRYGERRDVIEKKEIKNKRHAQDYVNRLLQKNHRNNFQIDLSVIASPYYNLLEQYNVKIPKYNINHNLVISRLNFNLTAGKAPTMDLTLNNYTPTTIT